MKVIDRTLGDITYAVKKVRLHLSLPGDCAEQLKSHKVFREVIALVKSTTQECNFTVRKMNNLSDFICADKPVSRISRTRIA